MQERMYIILLLLQAKSSSQEQARVDPGRPDGAFFRAAKPRVAVGEMHLSQ